MADEVRGEMQQPLLVLLIAFNSWQGKLLPLPAVHGLTLQNPAQLLLAGSAEPGFAVQLTNPRYPLAWSRGLVTNSWRR